MEERDTDSCVALCICGSVRACSQTEHSIQKQRPYVHRNPTQWGREVTPCTSQGFTPKWAHPLCTESADFPRPGLPGPPLILPAGTDFPCALLSLVSLVKLIVAPSQMQPLEVYSPLHRAIKMMNELAAHPCNRALRVDIDTQKIISLFRPFPVSNPMPQAPW